MTETISTAIAHLEHAERELSSHLAATQHALAALRGTQGVKPPATPVTPKERRQAPRRAPQDTNGNGTVSEDAIRSALKDGPLSPADLSARLHASRYQLRIVLDPLVERGAVITEGATTNRRLSLPGKPGKEVPQ